MFTKARYCDFEETYAPVVRYASIRLLIALAAEFDLDIDQMDVVILYSCTQN